MQASDRVLLIDVENLIGCPGNAPPAGFRARVTALRNAVGKLHHCVAAYGVVHPADRRCRSLLAEIGVVPRPVVPGPNAAEIALLQHASYVYKRGGRTFVVASCDHSFSRLAAFGRLEIVTWEGQQISRRLEEVAATVYKVRRPGQRNGILRAGG